MEQNYFLFHLCIIIILWFKLVLCSWLFWYPIDAIHVCLLGEASRDGSEEKENLSHVKQLKNVAFGILAAWAVTAASPVVAANQVYNTSPSQIFLSWGWVWNSHFVVKVLMP